MTDRNIQHKYTLYATDGVSKVYYRNVGDGYGGESEVRHVIPMLSEPELDAALIDFFVNQVSLDVRASGWTIGMDLHIIDCDDKR